MLAVPTNKGSLSKINKLLITIYVSCIYLNIYTHTATSQAAKLCKVFNSSKAIASSVANTRLVKSVGLEVEIHYLWNPEKVS